MRRTAAARANTLTLAGGGRLEDVHETEARQGGHGRALRWLQRLQAEGTPAVVEAQLKEKAQRGSHPGLL